MEIWQSFQNILPTISLGDIQLAWPVWVPAGVVSLLGGAYFLLQLWNNVRDFFAPEAATKKSQEDLKEQVTGLQGELASQTEDLKARIAELSTQLAQQLSGQTEADPQTTHIVGKAFDRGDSAEIEALSDIAKGETEKGFDELEAQARRTELDGDKEGASQKWFDLGLLTRDSRPRRAIRAFENMLRLGHKDLFWAPYFLSNLYIGLDGNLAHASDMAAKAKELATDPRQKSLALLISGDAARARSDVDAARSDFMNALEQAEIIADENGYREQDYRDIAVVIDRISKLYFDLRQWDEARAFYLQSVELSDKIVSADSADIFDRRDQAVAHASLGDVYVEMGDFQNADAEFRYALTATEDFLREDPDSARFLRDKMYHLIRIADLGSRRGNQAGAVENLQKARALVEQLLQIDPDAPEYRRELVRIDGKLADNDPENSQKWLLSALRIQKALIDSGMVIPDDEHQYERLKTRLGV